MSAPPGPSYADVVARLRAAGCVFAEEEARLLVAAAGTSDRLDALVRRRVDGEPLEHVLGYAEFCGLRVAVAPGVFVPRRRTELMVREAAALLRRDASRPDPPPRSVVLDLCCGSGAVAAALLATCGPVEVHATDIDPAALACARRNLAGSGARVYEGDLFDPLPPALQGRVDVLVANVPYVPTDAIALMPPEARLHEARTALDGGRDGLDVLRRVTAVAGRWLAPGGHLLVETSEGQAAAAAAVLRRDGLAARVVTSSDMGATVVVGSADGRPGRPAGASEETDGER